MVRHFICRAIVYLGAVLVPLLESNPSQNAGLATRQNELYWIFLTTGKATTGVAQEEIAAMQAAHLANFQRLHEEGPLLAAGPMADPDRIKRGIVVIAAPDLAALEAMFEPDPYVEKGYLKVEAVPVQRVLGEFSADVDPEGLDEFRLVVYSRVPDNMAPRSAEPMSETTAEYFKSIHDDDRLRYASLAKERGAAWIAIAVFRKMDDSEALQSLVDETPAVNSGHWKATVFPLYMSRGILD